MCIKITERRKYTFLLNRTLKQYSDETFIFLDFRAFVLYIYIYTHHTYIYIYIKHFIVHIDFLDTTFSRHANDNNFRLKKNYTYIKVYILQQTHATKKNTFTGFLSTLTGHTFVSTSTSQNRFRQRRIR